MTQRWRNTGAPFTRTNGDRVGRGDVFEASTTSKDVRMRRKKLEPVAPSTPRTAGGRHIQFAGVDFGSDAAYELARDEDLSWRDFRGKTGSGVDGAFLVSDVRGIINGDD